MLASRNPLRFLIAALSLGFGLMAAQPALGQQRVNPSTQIIHTIDNAAIRSILTEMGLSYDDSPIFDGYARVATSEGFFFHIGATACPNGQTTRCQGIAIIGYWYFNQARIQQVTTLTMDFARQYDFAKTFVAYLNPEGENVAFITRYVITDGGVTRANIRENISVFTQFLPIFNETLTGMGD